jgi:pimeloyl-ACP methyl ester carboxylesterase
MHAEFVVFDRVGHLPMFEAPGRTSDALRAFTARVTTRNDRP